MRDVYVTSADPVTAAADPVTAAADPVTAAKSPDEDHEPTAKKVDPTRPLPLDRTQYQDVSYLSRRGWRMAQMVTAQV